MGDDETRSDLLAAPAIAGEVDAPATATPDGRRARVALATADRAETKPRVGRRRGASKRAAGVAAVGAAPVPAAPEKPRRRGSDRKTAPHAREGGVPGLAERARLVGDPARLTGLHLLPDPLAVTLPEIRAALLHRPLDEALHALGEGLAEALAPAIAQVWIADAAPTAAPQADRVGGVELLPALRLRAVARAVARGTLERGSVALRIVPPDVAEDAPGPTEPAADVAASGPRIPSPFEPSALVREVAAARQPFVLADAAGHALAQEWSDLLRYAPGCAPLPTMPLAGSCAAGVATLVAYPLRARGQFLGVLAVGSAARIGPRGIAALEELADLVALAADRDRLMGYTRSQEALAQTVVRHAPVAMAVLTGADHVLALLNPTFGAMLGLGDDADAVGRRLADVLPEQTANLTVGFRLDAVYASGEPQAMIELPISLERGLTYWNVTTTPLAGISSSVGGVLIAAVEVTRQVIARHRAQESAEIAQERIGQMMTLHATSLAVASQLGADPRVLLADILRRSVALLGARAGTVYARDPQRDDLEVIVCQGLRGDYVGNRIRVGEGLAGQVARTGQGLIVDDYRVYPFRAAIYDDEAFRAVIAVPLIHHGQVVGVLDVLDDADRRAFTDDDLWLLDLFAAQAAQAIENARTYEQLERAYRKQRELDRMKDDFIATASHELRTPLTGVQGFLDLLLEYRGSRDDELASDFLKRAADSAQELAEIAERLLQTSRHDTGRIELHITPVRLLPVLEESLRSFRELERAQGGNHEFVAEVHEDAYVEADLGRLKEVLDNLIGNAAKYSPRGGRVTVRFLSPDFAGAAGDAAGDAAGTIEERPTMVLAPYLRGAGLAPETEDDAPDAPARAVVEASGRRAFGVITVSDEGMGIPDEERSRLFGRFSRLESARASQIRGTGLGLYICRQIARAMGGDVWLRESAPDLGSTFAVALPAAAPGDVTDPELVAHGPAQAEYVG